ncbi:MAG: Uma2 family endonuclease [Blastocatellia bacterium]
MSTLIQTEQPIPARETLPTMYDLPSEDFVTRGIPDNLYVHPAILLQETFRPPVASPDEVLSAIQLNLYYDGQRPRWCVQPDWFGVIGVPRLYEGQERWNYQIWHERVPPLIVLEFYSPRVKDDLLKKRPRSPHQQPTKWEVYEQLLHVPYYVVYDGEEEKIRVFHLTESRYREIEGREGRFWFPEAELGLGLWRGSVYGREGAWLRCHDARGDWIPTLEDRAEQARLEACRAQVEAEQDRKIEQLEGLLQQERRRSERLAEALRRSGQDPDKP